MEILHLWTLGFLIFDFFSCTSSYNYKVNEGGGPITCTYNRSAAIEKECGNILSLASDMNSNDRGYMIQSELYISNGDWEQDGTTSPLMSFDNSNLPNRSSDLSSLLKRVSFWVTNVNPIRWSENVISISGQLSIGISRSASLSYKQYGPSRFSGSAEISKLEIFFDGVYIETDVNGGERVMCLLGTSESPFPQKSIDPLGSVDSYFADHSYQAFLGYQMILILHYPQTFSLTSRVIYGEMKSLNEASNTNYFDMVHISSQLNPDSKYQFGCEELASKACNAYPYQNELTNVETENFQELEFCRSFQHLSDEVFDLVNWNCNGTDEYCSKLFPFLARRSMKATSNQFHKFKLVMQNLHCESGNDQNGHKTARVAAVFRVISPVEDLYSAVRRTGLSDMTFSAEGVWNSSSRQVCMVGFVGLPKEVSNSSVIGCLVFPVIFSLKQRSLAIATISSIGKRGSILLSFGKMLNPEDLQVKYMHHMSYLFYNYSKFEEASAIRKKSETLGNFLKKIFLRYSTIENGDDVESLSHLSDKLSLRVSAVQDTLPSTDPSITSVRMSILSFGPLFGGFLPQTIRTRREDALFHTKVAFSENQLMNVSAILTLDGQDHISMLFLEGLYDSLAGKMYLIGCRDIDFLGNNTAKGMDLEGRRDCMIEVIVEYSSKTCSLLIIPTIKFSISSQRKAADSLYFSPVSFKAHPFYQQKDQDIIFSKTFEKILQILLLSMAIACIHSQIVYAQENVESLPYMSLVMLGIQFLMFILPLVTGIEFLLKWEASCKAVSYRSEKYKWYTWNEVVVTIVKLLLLIASQLTLVLIHKVWKSRAILLQHPPLKLQQVPSDKLIILIISAIHTIGFVFFITLHKKNVNARPLDCVYVKSGSYSREMWGWMSQLQGYLVLVQDFILLPQIIANYMSEGQSRPLRKLYYMGFTIVRLFLHVYDYITDPMCEPCYSKDGLMILNLPIHSKVSDIMIPTVIVFLATMVYYQQSRRSETYEDADGL